MQPLANAVEFDDAGAVLMNVRNSIRSGPHRPGRKILRLTDAVDKGVVSGAER
jgi:hypothetical protein